MSKIKKGGVNFGEEDLGLGGFARTLDAKESEVASELKFGHWLFWLLSGFCQISISQKRGEGGFDLGGDFGNGGGGVDVQNGNADLAEMFDGWDGLGVENFEAASDGGFGGVISFGLGFDAGTSGFLAEMKKDDDEVTIVFLHLILEKGDGIRATNWGIKNKAFVLVGFQKI